MHRIWRNWLCIHGELHKGAWGWTPQGAWGWTPQGAWGLSSCSGLNDYELTEEDKKVLSLSTKSASNENGCNEIIGEDEVIFSEFRIEDIFNWQPQKEIDPLNIKKLTVKHGQKYPFYGQATLNNGIISYESLRSDVLNNQQGKPTILIHSNNQNIVYVQTPFYLKDGHGATSVLQSNFLNENNALYFITVIKKVITQLFSYNQKATKIALKNTKIRLPINNGKLNIDYMEKYVNAIKKLAITKVYQDKTLIIDTTKKVIA